MAKFEGKVMNLCWNREPSTVCAISSPTTWTNIRRQNTNLWIIEDLCLDANS